MAVLGINVAEGAAYYAILEADVIVESEPFRMELPPGLAGSDGLNSFVNAVELLIRERAITRVVIVGPENNYSATYAALVPRIAIETAILIAGARAHVPAERLSRPDVRSRLGLPQAGQLSKHCSSVLPVAGKHWSKKRDIAALGALCGGQQ